MDGQGTPPVGASQTQTSTTPFYQDYCSNASPRGLRKRHTFGSVAMTAFAVNIKFARIRKHPRVTSSIVLDMGVRRCNAEKCLRLEFIYPVVHVARIREHHQLASCIVFSLAARCSIENIHACNSFPNVYIHPSGQPMVGHPDGFSFLQCYLTTT
jgi:hypothetical protein